ncbi:Panacea domain-containing protein [Fictibacillus norfolkensis]|uniref:DUF4065 domain-containing protein n=1 Tax=Fictibacillus norfolkensis TaxID=2762233 RepID=A0ABR8SRZ0_9BACL|nr:type II toxin-antitoxin system antitoxin SocA domain-containing protein [Fictibacillus norfolkensis]MBD7966272.1 DUF4065 domain-containing protein [Fictibacillus norfolkensis]
MSEHFIILYSDYKSGRRIAFHKSDSHIDGIFEVLQLMDLLKIRFNHLSFGFHHLQTNDHSWESVVKYDKFFFDVTPISDFKQFKDFISGDLKVSALDVANLMTASLKCTHLKLQKLIYLFYCNFIKKYGYRPFEEEFTAWQYGPVIKEVYDKYKSYGKEEIFFEDDSETIYKEKSFKLSVFSKFMKTPYHQKVVEVLNETVLEYGHFNAYTLVDITHVKAGPWDLVFRDGLGRDDVIPHELIEEYCTKH